MTAMCAHCTKHPTHAVLCRGCLRTLHWALANIRAFLAGLDTMRTRQGRDTDPSPLRKGGAKAQPLPVDTRFTDPAGTGLDDQGRKLTWGSGTDLAWVAGNTLTTWCRILADDHPPRHGPACRDACLHVSCAAVRRTRPPTSTHDCCRYLAAQSQAIAAAEYAAELLDELLNLERRLRRFVDPADRWYAGPCTAGLSGMAGAWICGADLYVEKGKPEVRCANCGATYEVAARQEWLLGQAEDRWETAADLARALVFYSGGDLSAAEHQLAARIRKWADRGRLTRRDTVRVRGQECPRYRLGDVLTLVYGERRHTEEKAG